MSLEMLDKAISAAKSVVDKVEGVDQREEISLLVKDLESARSKVFVRTMEARPLVDRCANTAEALKEAVESEGDGDQKVAEAFDEFERAVRKLRTTIMVRTQKAT